MRRTLAALAVTVVAFSGCHHPRTAGHGARAKSVRASPVMSEVAIAIPIAAGKTEAWRAALAELVGPKYAEYDTSRTRYGLTSQTTFLQKTRMGDFALIHLTGPDVHKSFHAMSQSKDPWDVDWRELTLDLHGVDFAKGDQVIPEVELLFSMNSEDLVGTQPLMFVAPITPQGAVELREVAGALMGQRHAEYLAGRARIGVRREAVFLQSTALGDAVVFYWLAADPKASLTRLIDSTEPFDQWLRSTAGEIHPVSLDVLEATVKANTLVARYPRLN